ncbi:MAG: Fe-S cluster assembly ATPase SufC [Mycoplasma sp.]
MLTFNNVSISINNEPILENLSLEIVSGDIVAILGQNGQGKSTLLKTIMGYHEYQITQGNLTYNNIDILNKSVDERAKLGIFLANQSPIEIPGISMLDFFKSIYEAKNEKTNIFNFYKTVNSALSSVGLNEDFLERSINEKFSGGEKKKSEMAQMLILDPQLILLDEIDSGLDIDATKIIVNLLLDAKQKNKTIIFVSHHSELIEKLKPNKVVLIANNKIASVGGIEIANEILTNGYKKCLSKMGITSKIKNSIGSCAGHKSAK